MTVIDDQGRPEPPLAANEWDTLLGFLDYQRATFAWKCRGLDAAGLRTSIAASTMTLGGMVKHMSLVEDYWCANRLHGEPQLPWRDIDWDAEPDWEWRSAADETPEQLRDLWEATVERSRQRLSVAYAAGGLGHLAATPWPDGTSPSLRWILVHLIEEYARHNGHADLIREAVDGVTGE